MRRRVLVGIAVAAGGLLAGTAGGATRETAPTFADAGRQATATLLGTWYAAPGRWRRCTASDCATGNADWGDDSLTYALALRYAATRDARLLPPLRALVRTARRYPAACRDATACAHWSDVPEWDAIALLREWEATREPAALAKAKAAFASVERASVYALGACPAIRYQQPGGGATRVKTLETEANAVVAALLLYRATRSPGYLAAARARYAAVRRFFLDPAVPLYTVYVLDEGTQCRQLPHRFFASVNGAMISAGLELFRATGSRAYLGQAIATGRAVDRSLNDARGIFADLQAENDVAEPLVEGMLALAHRGQAFARAWILRNAAAAIGARAADGSFGRFFDGPPPAATVTSWQTNGGLALEIAAAALAPTAVVPASPGWSDAVSTPHEVSELPATITVNGSGVALLGTLGERCCEPGHARVLVDGRETFDRTGIWQNKSSSGRSIPGTALFAWRWPNAGTHTLTFLPGVPNAKEGDSFLHLTGYAVVG